MTKLGETPISLVLTRDQVRLIRGMIATTATAIGNELLPVFQELKDTLDNAETAGTIARASMRSRPGGNDGWAVIDSRSNGTWHSPS